MPQKSFANFQNGKVHAEDCTPSLLIVPAMMAQIFCCKPMESPYPLLLAGFQRLGYDAEFAVEGLGFSFGTISIRSPANSVKIHFFDLPKKPLRLVLRHLDSPNILEGGGRVLSVEGNTITLALKEKDVLICFA